MFLNKNYLILLSLLLSLIACKNEQKKHLPQKQFIYYENGKVRRAFETVNGIRQGKMTDFFPSGNIKAERFVKDDIQVGKTTIYFENGKVKEVQYYDDNGLRTNGDTLWYENGQFEFIAAFSKGKKNGNLTRFDTLGKVIYSADFKDDSLLRVNIQKYNQMPIFLSE